MNKLTFALLAMIMLFTTACASNGFVTNGPYTEETTTIPAVEAKAATNDASSDGTGTLPEIMPYEEPEIPALETVASNNESSNIDSTEEAILSEIPAYDDPEIPALDAPAIE